MSHARSKMKCLEGCNPGLIPVAPIRAVVLEYLRHQHPSQGSLGPKTALAVRSGVNPKRLSEIISGRGGKCVDFDIADRLFAAMGMLHLWYEQGTLLNRLYRNVDLSVPGRAKVWKPEMAKATCPQCGNDFAYIVERRQQGKQRLCSNRCAGLSGASLGGSARARAMAGRGALLKGARA